MVAKRIHLKRTPFSRTGGGIMPQFVHVPRPVQLDLAPAEVAARCRDLSGLVFFDSASETGSARSQISIIAANPSKMLRGNIFKKRAGENPGEQNDWDILRKEIESRRVSSRFDDGLPHGFAAGYIEYEGDFCFGFYEDALIYRHADESWHETGQMRALMDIAASDASARKRSEQPAPIPLRFAPGMDKNAYCGMVARAQEYIAAGDIYQVNLAHRFDAVWDGDSFEFYEMLRHYSPAPHAAFLKLDGRTILSTSPELFLKISGRAIETRPIKGTRPRRSEQHADEKSAYDLITSPKEIAELIMITDLERNDLGTVCEFGSVAARELLKLERFEHVFHLVSTISGQLRPEVDHPDALRACFPGGSITGAPKKRAREIISELEPVRRGVYTGALGWFGFNGESQFNIAIRTAVLEAGRVHFHAGAGIVADSVPEQEWQETLDKAAGMLLAAERFSK